VHLLEAIRIDDADPSGLNLAARLVREMEMRDDQLSVASQMKTTRSVIEVDPTALLITLSVDHVQHRILSRGHEKTSREPASSDRTSRACRAGASRCLAAGGSLRELQAQLLGLGEVSGPLQRDPEVLDAAEVIADQFVEPGALVAR
jgi:hypothetical protein